MEKIKIGLIGLGTVGSGFYQILHRSPQAHLFETKIAVKDIDKKRPLLVSKKLLTNNPLELINDPEIKIIIDASAAETHQRLNWVIKTLFNNKHLILTSKELTAKYLPQLQIHAQEKNRKIGLEATVCAGIPIVGIIENLLIPEPVRRVSGILNGTVNYILSARQERELSFREALAEAQRLGLAETDPQEDLMGIDSAYKLLILVQLLFKEHKTMEDFRILNGIQYLSSLYLQENKEKNQVVKLIAQAEKKEDGQIDLVVGPEIIASNNLLSQIKNTDNAIIIETTERQLFFVGPGAGAQATGAALMTDLLNIALKK